MTFEDDVINALDARPLGQSVASGRQPTTRLDTTVTKKPNAGISKSKVIQSGNMIEVYDFEKPVLYGYSPQPRKKRSVTTIRKNEYRKRTIIRAMNRIKRLSSLNFIANDKFLTLTFNNQQDIDLSDLSSCLPYYQRFIRKLRQIFPDLKFITVPEFQKRGAVHYHILCNIPFLTKKEFAKLWPYGFFKLKAIKSSTGLALYLSKYLAKRFDDTKKRGHRLYYTSRGLKQPKIIYGSNAEFISEQILTHKNYEVKYEKEYESEQNGAVKYKQHQKKS